MAKDIIDINYEYVDSLTRHEAPGEERQYYADSNFFIALNLTGFAEKNMLLNQIYRVDVGRVILVTKGTVRMTINLEELVLKSGAAVLLIPDSTFELIERSADLEVRLFTFKDLNVFSALDRHLVITLTDDEMHYANEYVTLMWHVLHRQPVITDAVSHLQAALLLELKSIAERQEIVRKDSATALEAHFNKFMALVREYGQHTRKIEFYADKMCVTPNHLSSIIKRASGLTVLQWLNRNTVQRAKLMLKYTDYTIWEIAEHLNFSNSSFFSKFFKRETGMSPKEYRKSIGR